MQIKAEIKGIEALQRKLQSAAETALKSTVDALNTTALAVQNDLKAETKTQGAIDTGTYRSSWQIERATTRNLTARVGTNLVPHYAPDIEYGTRPHFPPRDALKAWARRKLHNEAAWYPVARAIARRGTKARPVFRQGTDKAFERLEGQIKQAGIKVQRALDS